MKTRNKVILIILAVLLGLAIISIIYLSVTLTTTTKTSSDIAETTTVETGDLETLIYADGVVISDDSRDQFSVVTGTVTEILVNENQDVSEDETILKIDTGRTTEDINADISGTVTRINVKVGDTVGATMQKPLFEIDNLYFFSIESFIPESDISQIEEGQDVNLEFPGLENITAEGEVKFVAKTPEVQTTSNDVEYRILVSIDDIPDEIRLGMSVDLEIVTSTLNNVVVLDNDYIYSTNGTSYVYVVETDVNGTETLKQVDVELGTESDTQTEILSGVEAGDVVAISVSEEEATAAESEESFSIFNNNN